MQKYVVSETNDWKKYFPAEYIDPSSTLVITQEGEYSITRPYEAKQIINILSKYLPKKSTIIDGTASCGGDTISLALHFENIIAVELNKDNCDCLKNNLKAYNLSNQVNVICPKSIYDVVENNNFDMLFLDPPWGGRSYFREQTLNLYLCKTSTEFEKDCSENIYKLFESFPDKYFVLKTPTNFNYDEFLSQLPNRKIIKYPIFKYIYKSENNRMTSKRTSRISFNILVCEPEGLKGGTYYKYVKYKQKYIKKLNLIN